MVFLVLLYFHEITHFKKNTHFSKYYGNIYRKRSLLESFFNKVVGLIKTRLQHRCFPVNIAKFPGTPVLKNTYVGGV